SPSAIFRKRDQANW
ncbi:AMP-binding enzyme family protein, partial [Vibrio parahaemolyticus EKP-028]